MMSDDMEKAIEIGEELAKATAYHDSLSRRERYFISILALLALITARKYGTVLGCQPLDMWGALVGTEQTLMKHEDSYTTEGSERAEPSDVVSELLANVSAGVLVTRMGDDE